MLASGVACMHDRSAKQEADVAIAREPATDAPAHVDPDPDISVDGHFWCR